MWKPAVVNRAVFNWIKAAKYIILCKLLSLLKTRRDLVASIIFRKNVHSRLKIRYYPIIYKFGGIVSEPSALKIAIAILWIRPIYSSKLHKNMQHYLVFTANIAVSLCLLLLRTSCDFGETNLYIFRSYVVRTVL